MNTATIAIIFSYIDKNAVLIIIFYDMSEKVNKERVLKKNKKKTQQTK